MEPTEGWNPGPKRRRTLDILWACFATMALCVWMAVHPNILAVYSFWPFLFKRLQLMLLAIIFPELVPTSGWDERRQANALFSEIKTHPHTTGDLHPGQTGNLSAIAVEEIEERSKADVFAKAAVVGQCLWFALTVIGRLFQGLPVTPLETHTVIHVGCAILIYTVWMHKPYNLSHCLVVRGPNMDCIGAQFNFHEISRKVFLEEIQMYEQDRIAYWKQRLINSTHGTSTTRSPPARPVLQPITELLHEYKNPMGYGCDEKIKKIKVLHAIAADASKGLELLESLGCHDFHPAMPGDLSLLREDGSQNMTIRRVWGGWSTDVGHEPSAAKAVHALFNFPTEVERWLWRASARCLVAVPFWEVLWIAWLEAVLMGIWIIVAVPLSFTLLVVYTLARCYFLVEAIVGLREMPWEVYLTMQWTSFLPHVS
ncbi:hypothetical protein BJY01DRAFT_264125 [Aspergillus pseudoustus]|uniref:Uncharacterized protein n=1 Tax=Aspergillus pseudoustus TaxID=1810923 RepID=A0ABR4JVT7_9EURO